MIRQPPRLPRTETLFPKRRSSDLDGPKTLADLIAFNKAHPEELRWFDQSLFELAETKGGLDDPAYLKAKAKAARLAGPEGIDRLLKGHGVDLLVGVTRSEEHTSELQSLMRISSAVFRLNNP